MPNPLDDPHFFYELLQTPEGTLDINKLLIFAGFPVFALPPQTLSFRLYSIGAPSVRKVGVVGQDIRSVILTYTHPGAIEYERMALVKTLNKALDPMDEHGQEWFMRSSLVISISSLLPASFRPRIKPEDFPQHYFDTWEAGMAAWGTQPAALPFERFSLEEPFPLLLAHGTMGKVIVGVGAFGVSHADFELLLNSIVLLEEDSEWVEALQKENDDAGRERMAWGKSKMDSLT